MALASSPVAALASGVLTGGISSSVVNAAVSFDKAITSKTSPEKGRLSGRLLNFAVLAAAAGHLAYQTYGDASSFPRSTVKKLARTPTPTRPQRPSTRRSPLPAKRWANFKTHSSGDSASDDGTASDNGSCAEDDDISDDRSIQANDDDFSDDGWADDLFEIDDNSDSGEDDFTPPLTPPPDDDPFGSDPFLPSSNPSRRVTSGEAPPPPPPPPPPSSTTPGIDGYTPPPLLIGLIYLLLVIATVAFFFNRQKVFKLVASWFSPKSSPQVPTLPKKLKYGRRPYVDVTKDMPTSVNPDSAMMVLSFLDNDNGNGKSVCDLDKDTYVYWSKDAKELAEKYLANRTPDGAAQAQAPASAPAPTDLIVYQGERAKGGFSLAGLMREVVYWSSLGAKWAYGLPMAWRLIVTVVLPALVAPFFVIGKGRKYRKAEPQVNEEQVVEDTEHDQDVETETPLENGQDSETEARLANGDLEKDHEDQEVFEYVQYLKPTPAENGDLQAQALDDKDAGEKFVYTGTSSILSDPNIDDTELNATTVSSWDFGSNNRQDENGQDLERPGTARATEIDRENIPSSHTPTNTHDNDDGHLRVNALNVNAHLNVLNVDGHHSDVDGISTCATYDPSPEVSFDPINGHLPPASSASDVASVPLVDLPEDGKRTNPVGSAVDDAAGSGAGKRTQEMEDEEKRQERVSSLGSFNDMGASIHAPTRSAIPPLEERLTRPVQRVLRRREEYGSGFRFARAIGSEGSIYAPRRAPPAPAPAPSPIPIVEFEDRPMRPLRRSVIWKREEDFSVPVSGTGPALTSVVRASTPAPDSEELEEKDEEESRPSKMRRRRSLAKVDETEEGNSSAPQESTPTPTRDELQEQTVDAPTASVQQPSFEEKLAPMSASIHAPTHTVTVSEEQSLNGPTASVQQQSFEEKFAPMSASIHAPTPTVPEEELVNCPTTPVQQPSFEEKFAPMSASIHAPTPTVPEEELVETPAPAVAAAATPQDVVITPELCEQELTDEEEDPVPAPSTPNPQQDVVETPELCKQPLTDEEEDPVPTPSMSNPQPRAVPPLIKSFSVPAVLIESPESPENPEEVLSMAIEALALAEAAISSQDAEDSRDSEIQLLANEKQVPVPMNSAYPPVGAPTRPCSPVLESISVPIITIQSPEKPQGEASNATADDAEDEQDASNLSRPSIERRASCSDLEDRLPSPDTSRYSHALCVSDPQEISKIPDRVFRDDSVYSDRSLKSLCRYEICGFDTFAEGLDEAAQGLDEVAKGPLSTFVVVGRMESSDEDESRDDGDEVVGGGEEAEAEVEVEEQCEAEDETLPEQPATPSPLPSEHLREAVSAGYTGEDRDGVSEPTHASGEEGGEDTQAGVGTGEDKVEEPREDPVSSEQAVSSSDLRPDQKLERIFQRLAVENCNGVSGSIHAPREEQSDAPSSSSVMESSPKGKGKAKAEDGGEDEVVPKDQAKPSARQVDEAIHKVIDDFSAKFTDGASQSRHAPGGEWHEDVQPRKDKGKGKAVDDTSDAGLSGTREDVGSIKPSARRVDEVIHHVIDDYTAKFSDGASQSRHAPGGEWHEEDQPRVDKGKGKAVDDNSGADLSGAREDVGTSRRPPSDNTSSFEQGLDDDDLDDSTMDDQSPAKDKGEKKRRHRNARHRPRSKKNKGLNARTQREGDDSSNSHEASGSSLREPGPSRQFSSSSTSNPVVAAQATPDRSLVGSIHLTARPDLESPQAPSPGRGSRPPRPPRDPGTPTHAQASTSQVAESSNSPQSQRSRGGRSPRNGRRVSNEDQHHQAPHAPRGSSPAPDWANAPSEPQSSGGPRPGRRPVQAEAEASSSAHTGRGRPNYSAATRSSVARSSSRNVGGGNVEDNRRRNGRRSSSPTGAANSHDSRPPRQPNRQRPSNPSGRASAAAEASSWRQNLDNASANLEEARARRSSVSSAQGGAHASRWAGPTMSTDAAAAAAPSASANARRGNNGRRNGGRQTFR